jgi:hypothetical protein
MSNLGRIIKLGIQEIREIWPSEERELSPWISDNIDSLNDLLNLQIEIEGREEHIHNFRLDLTGTDNASQIPVVIENQFGESDHDHLGKLITYSAVKEAGIMIWIANEIQSAHKAAIEWLNKISPQEMTFYGIELEVFRIDDSLPAPNFRVVAGPPPSKIKPPSDEISPRNILYQEFFQRLRTRILENAPNFTRAKALPQSWWGLGIGRSGFSVSSAFTIDNKFRIEIYIDTGKKENNDLAFAELRESSSSIHEKVGKELIWDPLPESRACRIFVARDGTIDDDQEKLAEIVEWATPLVIKFREVFGPLVKNIHID